MADILPGDLARPRDPLDEFAICREILNTLDNSDDSAIIALVGSGDRGISLVDEVTKVCQESLQLVGSVFVGRCDDAKLFKASLDEESGRICPPGEDGERRRKVLLFIIKDDAGHELSASVLALCAFSDAVVFIHDGLEDKRLMVQRAIGREERKFLNAVWPGEMKKPGLESLARDQESFVRDVIISTLIQAIEGAPRRAMSERRERLEEFVDMAVAASKSEAGDVGKIFALVRARRFLQRAEAAVSNMMKARTDEVLSDPESAPMVGHRLMETISREALDGFRRDLRELGTSLTLVEPIVSRMSADLCLMVDKRIKAWVDHVAQTSREGMRRDVLSLMERVESVGASQVDEWEEELWVRGPRSILRDRLIRDFDRHLPKGAERLLGRELDAMRQAIGDAVERQVERRKAMKRDEMERNAKAIEAANRGGDPSIKEVSEFERKILPQFEVATREADGGYVIRGRGVVMNIPGGAFPKAPSISLQRVGEGSFLERPMRIIEASGMQPSKPITVTIPTRRAEIEALQEGAIYRLEWLNVTSGKWEEEPTLVRTKFPGAENVKFE
jgi:hypothetical protein